MVTNTPDKLLQENQVSSVYSLKILQYLYYYSMKYTSIDTMYDKNMKNP